MTLKRMLAPFYGKKLCPICKKREIDVLSKKCRDCFRGKKWGKLSKLRKIKRGI